MLYAGSSLGSVEYGSLSQEKVVTASITLPVLTVSATSLNHSDASLTLPQFTTEFAGHLAVTASLSFPILSVQGGSGATGVIDLPLLNVVATSGITSTGDVVITLPQFTTSFAGHLPADINITLPLLSVQAGSVISAPDPLRA